MRKRSRLRYHVEALESRCLLSRISFITAGLERTPPSDRTQDAPDDNQSRPSSDTDSSAQQTDSDDSQPVDSTPTSTEPSQSTTSNESSTTLEPIQDDSTLSNSASNDDVNSSTTETRDETSNTSSDDTATLSDDSFRTGKVKSDPVSEPTLTDADSPNRIEQDGNSSRPTGTISVAPTTSFPADRQSDDQLRIDDSPNSLEPVQQQTNDGHSELSWQSHSTADGIQQTAASDDVANDFQQDSAALRNRMQKVKARLEARAERMESLDGLATTATELAEHVDGEPIAEAAAVVPRIASQLPPTTAEAESSLPDVSDVRFAGAVRAFAAATEWTSIESMISESAPIDTDEIDAVVDGMFLEFEELFDPIVVGDVVTPSLSDWTDVFTDDDGRPWYAAIMAGMFALALGKPLRRLGGAVLEQPATMRPFQVWTGGGSNDSHSARRRRSWFGSNGARSNGSQFRPHNVVPVPTSPAESLIGDAPEDSLPRNSDALPAESLSQVETAETAISSLLPFGEDFMLSLVSTTSSEDDASEESSLLGAKSMWAAGAAVATVAGYVMARRVRRGRRSTMRRPAAPSYTGPTLHADSTGN